MPRQLFKFYRSYFDVASELNDKDRLLFYDALMKRQFLGIEPNLKGISKIVYVSQKHSIDAQIKGWEDKTGESLYAPIQGGSVGGALPPTLQEEEEVKVKEEVEVKEKLIPEFSEFLNYALEKEPLLDEKFVKLKYESWIENGWKNGNGNPIKNWKSNLLNTIPYIQKNQNGSNQQNNSADRLKKQFAERVQKTMGC